MRATAIPVAAPPFLAQARTMKLLAPDLINRIAADPANVTQGGLDIVVDRTRPFLPEHHTQLYFTPLYAGLHHEHRLRYNQLFGLRVNEYIMMLESDLIERLLTPLRRHPAVRSDAAMVTAIDTMIEEERLHFRNFADLNRVCRPDLYPPGEDRLFSKTPGWTRALFWGVGALAGQLSFALWYLMAMEESSMTLAREMMRDSRTETLGPLDEGFLKVHAEHMKDETRHVHIDAHLIARTIGAQSRRRRGLNARLFAGLVRTITTPTRGGSGVKVIRQLVREMPELRPREEEMIAAVLALKDDRAFQQSLFNRAIMPRTFELFDETDEFADLGERMPGYDRR